MRYPLAQVVAYDRPRDHNERRFSGTATVSIRVLDKNDNAPVIVKPLDGAEYKVKFEETVGYKVLEMQATDADEGSPNAEVRYIISSGGHDMFGLESDLGVLFLKRPLKDTHLKVFNLRLTAYDLGPGRLNSSVKVCIRVYDGMTLNEYDTNQDPHSFNEAGGGGRRRPGGGGAYDDRTIVICLAVLFALLLLGAAVLAIFIKRKRDLERGGQHRVPLHAKYQLGESFRQQLTHSLSSLSVDKLKMTEKQHFVKVTD